MSRKRILLVCLRRLGDVLLTTPLAGSLRDACPGWQIDWLVFHSTAGILAKNPAADRVLTLPDSPSGYQTLKMALKILGRYDIGISAQAGDRPNLFARLAGPKAFGLGSEASGGGIRNALMTAVVSPKKMSHQVDKVLDICALIGVPRKSNILVPEPLGWPSLIDRLTNGLLDSSQELDQLRSREYWVIHPGAAFPYKQWTVQGWVSLIEHLQGSGASVLISGGPSKAEGQYLSAIFAASQRVSTGKSKPPVIPLWRAGLDWPALAGLLSAARGFVGVDTSVTHLAGALGTPVVPIFGPTNPLLWAPIGLNGEPLVVLQNKQKTCVPCQLEGCNRHIQSHSACLDELRLDSVIEFINKMNLTEKSHDDRPYR